MEDKVVDTILLMDDGDPILSLYIELALKYREGEPVFPNYIKAPSLFVRHFVGWVGKGMTALEKSNDHEGGVPPAPL